MTNYPNGGSSPWFTSGALRVIPADPSLVPDEAALERARAAGAQPTVFDGIEFVHADGPFEPIGCPSCGREIDGEWWAEAMDHAFARGFSSLEYAAPCCNATVSLNDLRYATPAGFARVVCEGDPTAVARALAVPVRVL